jgi:hypothetical protein
MTRKSLVLASLIVALGALHLATLRQGQEWGDDFSLYVAHARNLAEGRPYADTGYVYNRADPILSPRTYPPMFPLLLVPVYLVWGMNLTAMKIWGVLLFMALLGVLALLMRERLPFHYVIGCLTLFALNPYIWQQKDRLLSETPFMLFAYLSLVLAGRAWRQETGKGAFFWGLAAGMAAYLAFGTRTVGVVLIPSFIVCDWLRRRRIGVGSAAMVAAFFAGVAVQKRLLAVEGSYLDQLLFDPALYVRIALSEVRALGYFLENGYSDAARLLLFACLCALACWTYLARLRDARSGAPVESGLTACELFAVFNAFLLMFWPAAENERRFLVPVLPLFFLWAAEGLHRLSAASLRCLEMPIAAALALAVLLSYAGWYGRMDTGPIHDGVTSPEAVALFDWVQQHTDRGDVFLFQKPRAFALYTGRHSLSHHKADDAPRLARTLREHGANHVVVYYSSPFPIFQNSARLVETFIADNPSSFDQVYENRSFRVYRLRWSGLASR